MKKISGSNGNGYKLAGQNTLGSNVFKPNLKGGMGINTDNPRIKLENSLRYAKNAASKTNE